MLHRRLYNSNNNTPVVDSLIHHFPLSYNGELSDIIGKGVITPQGNRFTWDASAGMYLLTSGRMTTGAVMSGLNLGMKVGETIKNISVHLTVRPKAKSYATIGIFSGLFGCNIGDKEPIVALGQTAKLALTFDNNSIRKVYIDGEQRTEAEMTTPVVENDNTTNNLGYSNYHEGTGTVYISNIRIYKKCLTQEEINNY